MSPDQSCDVVVIGAGLQGLVAAKTCLEIDPYLKLVILEADRTVGGVWAREKIYPGLIANNILGTFEYADYPMDDSFGVKQGKHIPGLAISNYLESYARQFGLLENIRFNSRVTAVERKENRWIIRLSSPKTKPEYEVSCCKLLVCTGLTSNANPVNVKQEESFTASVVSFAKYAQYAAQVLSDSSIEHITVCGGGKAAYDIVYSMATHDKQVTWIIRASGNGPTPMTPAHMRLGPWKIWTEKVLTSRPFTWLSPCIWSHFDGFSYVQRSIQTTRLGRRLTNLGVAAMEHCLYRQAGIVEDAETRKLIPDDYLLWYGSSSAILNYPTNFYDYIRNGQVSVLRKDISCLKDRNIVSFTDDSTIETDAVICSTGWKHTPNFEFLPTSIHSDLGIPSPHHTQEQTLKWAWLNSYADKEILHRLPILNHDRPKKPTDSATPNSSPIIPSLTPWRLWRGIAPPSLPNRNIVFLGMFSCPQSALRSEISALWAYAYLFDKLDEPVKSISTIPPRVIDNQEEKLYDTAIFQRYGVWRTPKGHGAKYADAVFEGLPYLDMLLSDLGLRRWRKGWGILGEVFGGGYCQRDYRGIVSEWVEKERRKGKM